MDALKDATRFVYRLVVLWMVDVISLMATAAILPGFEIQAVDDTSALVVAVAAALLLGIVNLLIRPVILLLALPLGLIGVFVAGFFVNTIALRITAALLPGFGGKGMWGHHVHEAVLKAGCKVSGCTVHFCTNEYDKGPIIVQRCCSVEDDDTPDTLAERVFEQECIAYPEAIRLFAEGKLSVQDDRVKINSGVKTKTKGL